MNYIEYYYKGQIHSKCFYVKGKLHGENIVYHINGQVWEKCFYVNGKLHGEYIDYYEDGSVNWHYLYVNGELLIDLKESPVDDEDKMLLTLQYGVEWL
jgi:antitoxin component YwqK of YwqJK toxin-antitoxin module